MRAFTLEQQTASYKSYTVLEQCVRGHWPHAADAKERKNAWMVMHDDMILYGIDNVCMHSYIRVQHI